MLKSASASASPSADTLKDVSLALAPTPNISSFLLIPISWPFFQLSGHHRIPSLLSTAECGVCQLWSLIFFQFFIKREQPRIHMFGGGIQIACLIWNDVKTLVCAVVYHGSDQKRRNESQGTEALATNHPILVTPGLSQTRPDTIGITINQANKDCLYKYQVQIPRGLTCPPNNRHISKRIVLYPCILHWLRILLFRENKI